MELSRYVSAKLRPSYCYLIVLELALLLSKQVASQSCYRCVPFPFYWSLNFQKTCDSNKFLQADGTEVNSCEITRTNATGNYLPTVVSLVEFTEFDNQMMVISQGTTPKNQSYYDRQQFYYESSTSPNKIPSYLQVHLVGENSNEGQVNNTWIVEFTAICDSRPSVFVSGESLGWVEFSNRREGYYCEGAKNPSTSKQNLQKQKVPSPQLDGPSSQHDVPSPQQGEQPPPHDVSSSQRNDPPQQRDDTAQQRDDPLMQHDALFQKQECRCAPKSFQWTLNFTKTCNSNNLAEQGEDGQVTGIDFVLCNNAFFVPVVVHSVIVLELDANSNEINRDIRTEDLSDGDQLMFESISLKNATEIPSRILVYVDGKNSGGIPVKQSWIVDYTNSCDAPAFAQGDSLGWVYFSDVGINAKACNEPTPPAMNPHPQM